MLLISTSWYVSTRSRIVIVELVLPTSIAVFAFAPVYLAASRAERD